MKVNTLPIKYSDLRSIKFVGYIRSTSSYMEALVAGLIHLSFEGAAAGKKPLLNDRKIKDFLKLNVCSAQSNSMNDRIALLSSSDASNCALLGREQVIFNNMNPSY